MPGSLVETSIHPRRVIFRDFCQTYDLALEDSQQDLMKLWVWTAVPQWLGGGCESYVHNNLHHIQETSSSCGATKTYFWISFYGKELQ